MNLKLQNQSFLICGASSGFGRAIARELLEEGALVFAVARRKEKLDELAEAFPEQVISISGDLTHASTLNEVLEKTGEEQLHGTLINGGGPPALSALETSMDQWDEAYKLVMRWKIELALKLIPRFEKHSYGRVLFVESQSVKQPIQNLVLSNAFRAGMVGFAKTLSQEVAGKGITVNVLAPGSHETPAIERVIEKRAHNSGKDYETVKKEMESSIPAGRMGTAEEIASLAAWLLSPKAGYVTGQTISHDGGSIQSIFG